MNNFDNYVDTFYIYYNSVMRVNTSAKVHMKC